MFFDKNKTKLRKSATFLVIFLMGLSQFFWASPAFAQGGELSFDTGLNPFFRGEKARTTILNSLLASSLGGLMETFSYFTRKIAYDTAVYVAAGGKGEAALIFEDGFGKYLENTAKDSVASGIGEFGKPLGLNLCQVPDPRVNVFLQIGLRAIYGQGPTPNCTWQQLTSGGIFDPDAWNDRYGSTEKLASTFSGSLKVENTDFGVALGAMAQVDRIQAQAREDAMASRLEGNGFKPVTSLITGDILTPGQLVQKETEKLTATHQGEVTSQQIAGIYGAGMEQIIPSAISVFLNTFVSQGLQNILEGLLPDGRRGEDSESGGVFDPYSSNGVGLREAAERAFTYLFTAPVKQTTDYDPISEFAACPESPGLNNCVVDSSLQKLLTITQSNQPITIREALDQGLLHGDWPLISPKQETQNTNIRDCVVGKYCYSNLQKLRKIRVLPLGFEIAALRSDSDHPWTLKLVVDNFENCARDNNGNVLEDPRFPFCHLINPNWVMRAPVSRCEAEVYGPQLLDSDGPERRKECVDVKTCLLEGRNGECIGTSYGYCTKEKNVWRLPGESCPSYYNTCTTFTNTGTDEITSYLAKTLDYGECTADSVGCRAYSLEQNNAGWITTGRGLNGINLTAWKQAGRNRAIYFDETVIGESNVCNADNIGCSAFYSGARDSSGEYATTSLAFAKSERVVYFKKAPDYLGCYDTNREANSPEINWPRTIQEARNVVSQDARCDAFASVCAAEEVGCEAFKPVNGEVEIPGKIGRQNACPVECVGYDTFKEEASAFDRARFPVNFIPGEAESCSAAYVGCSEFTNIDVSARGGEGREYYTDIKYCERPAADNTNIQTYYSWEGSVTEGFIIRIHKLLPIQGERNGYLVALRARDAISQEVAAGVPAGSPAYNDDSAEALLDQYDRCHKANYELRVNSPYNVDAAEIDCRALFDRQGRVFYRLLSQTITVSDACHPMRKTEPAFYIDDNLQDAASCARKQGNFVGNDCQRCTNGGQFEGGSCVYWTISTPGEAESCPAEANKCRSYVGNAGRNIAYLVQDDFEPNGDSPDALLSAMQGWTTVGLGGGANQVRISGEATHVGLHSLEVLGNTASVYRFIPTSTPISKDTTYEITFWARGEAQRLDIQFSQGLQEKGRFTVDPVTNISTPVVIGTTWQRYTLGPVRFTGDVEENAAAVFLQFERNNARSGAYFIDHVELTRVDENLPLIKDSWKTPEGFEVPTSCDTRPEDGLPGEMLGCSAYNDSRGNSRYATGFEQLCRPKAIGCQPVWDTFNTVNGNTASQAEAFNVRCAGPERQTCRVNVAGVELGSCEVQQGHDNCFVQKVVLPPGQQLPAVNMASSTLIIPADTPSSTPIYLAVRPEFECGESGRGCQSLGMENLLAAGFLGGAASVDHSDTFVKNDPEIYDRILCRDDLVGCGEFRSGDKVSYFKDPIVTGGSMCYYRSKSTNDLAEESGWFLKDIGDCYSLPGLAGARLGRSCKTNDQCNTILAGGGEVKGECRNIGNLKCYPDFQRPGSFYDIYSNGDANYRGRTGLCEDQYNACTELVDVADTSQVYPEGKPYYSIFDETMQKKVSECEGKVSLTGGCVLFDKTDNPNKFYNSAATYAASEQTNPKYDPVSPITSGQKDANVILKVDRDRACSEWLSCQTSLTQKTEDGVRDLCYQYKACVEMNEQGQCVRWINDTANPDFRAEERLTYYHYVNRDTSWYGEDYTGYSLFNKYQINNLVYLYIDPVGDYGLQDEKFKQIESFVAYEQSEASLVNSPDLICQNKENWLPCGASADGVAKGRCYKEQCIYPLEGKFSNDVINSSTVNIALDEVDINSCKGFPESDSPYPTIVGGRVDPDTNIRHAIAMDRIEFTNKSPDYNGANICQDGNCSCEYDKVNYKNSSQEYRSIGRNDFAPGICSGGDNDGNPCQSDDDCIVDLGEGSFSTGVCSKVAQREQHIGLQGYCLEKDLSRPIPYAPGEFQCLTWLPIQVSASGVDIYNRNMDAGYNPNIDAKTENSVYGKNYCLYGDHLGGESPANDQYDEWFSPDLSSPADDERVCVGSGSCDAQYGGNIHYPSEYHEAVCDGRADVSDAITNNLKKRLGLTNVLFLRNENASTDQKQRSCNRSGDIGNTGGYNAVFDHDSGEITSDYGAGDCGVNADGAACIIYHFAPSTLSDDMLEYGTVMHPPRAWGELVMDADFNTVETHRAYTYRTGAPTPRKIAPAHMAPGGTEFLDHIGAAMHLISDVSNEMTLRETDLSKVYFVPTAFPWGADGVNLPLLTLDYHIDFLELNSQPQHALRFPMAGGSNYDPNDDKFVPTHDDTLIQGYAYKLDRQQITRLAYGDYEGQFAPEFQTVYNSRLERNEIHSRYVVVYGQSGPTFPFATNIAREATPPVDLLSDPFGTAPCSGDTDNWLAIGMDFNQDGEFLGYISRWCNGSPDSGENGIQFMVLASVNEWCSTITKVYQDTGVDILRDITNKAWTNRVWLYANESHPYDAYGNLLKATAFTPFGSIDLRSPFGNFDIDSQYFVPDSVTSTRKFRGLAFPFGDSSQGVPYACRYCNALTGDRSHPYSQDLVNVINGKTLNDASTALSQLFAKRFLTVDFSAPTIEAYEASSPEAAAEVNALRSSFQPPYRETGEEDLSSSTTLHLLVGEKLVPPQIYSLNPSICFTNNSKSCPVGEKDNITINQNNGVNRDDNNDGFVDEDGDGDGVNDPLVGIGNFTAVTNFYAWADDNRMPLRHILVRWGDGSDDANNGKTGLYKNHKPYCKAFADEPLGLCGTSDSNALKKGITCKTNSDCPAGNSCRAELGDDRFGNKDRACETGYYEFIHSYSCGFEEQQTSNYVAVGSLDASIRNYLNYIGNTAQKVCIFTPQVQAIDNWEWCNGACNDNNGDDVTNLEDGCYDEKLDDFGAIIHQCQEDLKAWTPYQGNIIVIPVQN